jgi:hypothetical protein
VPAIDADLIRPPLCRAAPVRGADGFGEIETVVRQLWHGFLPLGCTYCCSQVNDREPNRKYEPGLPHAPRKGGYGHENGKMGGGEGLRFSRQQGYAQDHHSARKRDEDRSHHAGLQKQIVGVLLGVRWTFVR